MTSAPQPPSDKPDKPKSVAASGSRAEQETIVSNLGEQVDDQTRPTRHAPARPTPAAGTKVPSVQTMVTQMAGGPEAGRAEHQTISTDLHVEGGAKPKAAKSSGSHHHQVWGDFELGDLLGRGGMGSVYRGRQISLDRPVAIKVLPANLSENENFKQRFLLEAKAVAQISSPHVIQVYFAGLQDGHHYFAMEFVEGDDLARRLKDGFRPSYREALDLVIQAARGLVAAGEHDIVHRDIKPANMMVTKKGLLKLMDFGLVRLARSDETGLTMAGTIMGTVSYFSPEQGRGERCDCRTDIYAIGVVFYEMLCRKLPFTGGDATSVIYQHIHASPRPPKEIDPNIPEDFQAVVLKCLQKEPEHRYQTAAELLSDLEAIAAGNRPITAFLDMQGLRHGATMVKHGQFQRERSRSLVMAALAVMAVAAAGAGWWWTHRAKEPLRTPGPEATAVVVPAAHDPAPVPPAAAQPVAVAPAAAPPAPATPTSPAEPTVSAIDQARLYLKAGNFSECRKLVDLNREAHPDDRQWTELFQALEQAQGRAELSAGQAAFARGDYDAAGKAAIAAQGRLGDDPALKALLAQIAEKEGARKQRDRQREEAENLLNEGNFAKAEALLVRLQAEDPADSTVDGVLRRARKMREDHEAIEKAVNGQLAQADQALARKDFDGALLAFTAAKQLDPKSERATAGLDQVTSIKQQLATLREQFEAAIKERNLAAAQQQLERMRALAPGSPTLVLAENVFANSKLVEEAQAKAVADRAQQLGGLAKDLAAQIDDLKQPIPVLELALKDFLAKAGADHPQRQLLEQKLEDRRQRVRVSEALAGLDAAMSRKDAPALKSVVADAGLVEALTALMAYPGLVYESRLDDFARTGQSATAKVSLRHALTIYPERRLVYQYDLRQDAQGWIITAAHLQP